MVLKCQGTPNTPNQRVTGTHFNPARVPLQAAPYIGGGNSNTSATGKDYGRCAGRGGDCSDSAETTNRAGRSSIRDKDIAPGYLDEGGYTRKGPRHKTVRQTVECDKVGVPLGKHPYITVMDNNGANL